MVDDNDRPSDKSGGTADGIQWPMDAGMGKIKAQSPRLRNRANQDTEILYQSAWFCIPRATCASFQGRLGKECYLAFYTPCPHFKVRCKERTTLHTHAQTWYVCSTSQYLRKSHKQMHIWSYLNLSVLFVFLYLHRHASFGPWFSWHFRTPRVGQVVKQIVGQRSVFFLQLCWGHFQDFTGDCSTCFKRFGAENCRVNYDYPEAGGWVGSLVVLNVSRDEPCAEMEGYRQAE